MVRSVCAASSALRFGNQDSRTKKRDADEGNRGRETRQATIQQPPAKPKQPPLSAVGTLASGYKMPVSRLIGG